MHTARTAERHNALASAARPDEDVAGRSAMRLLMTGSTHGGVEALTRRIRGAGPRAQFPFERTWGRDFPIAREALPEHRRRLFDAAAGGSLLISAVEEMPLAVQNALIEPLAGTAFTRGPWAGARMVSGTTVSLLERVAAGTFPERLFYRLNTIHLTADDRPPVEAALA